MKWNMLCTSINFNFKYHEIYNKTSFRTLRSLTFIKMWRVLISPVNSLQMPRNLKAFPLSQFKLRLQKTIPHRKLKNTTITAFVVSRAFHWPYPGKRVNMLYVLKGFFFVQVSPIILALRKCFIDHCTSEYCVSDTTEDVTMVGVVWITKAILELINRLQRNWVPCMSPHSIAVR